MTNLRMTKKGAKLHSVLVFRVVPVPGLEKEKGSRATQHAAIDLVEGL
jgi:hypothetical protein